MNALDASIIRNVRRELSRRPFESARVDVSVTQGRVTLGGVITRLRDQPDVNLKSEMDLLQKLIMRDRNVREVSQMVRLVEEIVDKEDHDTRGRMRH
jgi:hypothetical protein